MILFLYKDKTFHEPILRSLNRFIGCRISDSPTIASLDFVTIFFSEQVCQPYVQPPAILEDRLDCLLTYAMKIQKQSSSLE